MDLMALIVLLYELTTSIFFIFILCEFGERVAGAFNGINNVLDQFDFYLFSIETQKMLLTIISLSQEPAVVFHASENISATRKFFKKVSQIE